MSANDATPIIDAFEAALQAVHEQQGIFWCMFCNKPGESFCEACALEADEAWHE